MSLYECLYNFSPCTVNSKPKRKNTEGMKKLKKHKKFKNVNNGPINQQYGYWLLSLLSFCFTLSYFSVLYRLTRRVASLSPLRGPLSQNLPKMWCKTIWSSRSAWRRRGQASLTISWILKRELDSEFNLNNMTHTHTVVTRSRFLQEFHLRKKTIYKFLMSLESCPSKTHPRFMKKERMWR